MATTLQFPDSCKNEVYGRTQAIVSTSPILGKRVYPRATGGCKSRVILRYLRRKSITGQMRTPNYIYNFKEGGIDGSIILVNKSTQHIFLPDGFTKEPFGYQRNIICQTDAKDSLSNLLQLRPNCLNTLASFCSSCQFRKHVRSK